MKSTSFDEKNSEVTFAFINKNNFSSYSVIVRVRVVLRRTVVGD